jgi:hypothetical protein
VGTTVPPATQAPPCGFFFKLKVPQVSVAKPHSIFDSVIPKRYCTFTICF